MKGKSKGKSNWIIIGVVLISTVFIFGLLIANKDAIEEGFFGGGNKKYSVEYYYMDGCGHCDDFNKSGVWEKLNKMEWKNVSLHKYNCEEHMDRVKMFNIRGFPSIIIVDNSATPKMIASFEEERTEQKLLQFIKEYEQ
jgi:thiol-disulfide isomerase/thioredoxin